jgi:hypothetical protein
MFFPPAASSFNVSYKRIWYVPLHVVARLNFHNVIRRLFPIDFLTRLCAAEPFATVCENTARLGHFVCVITTCVRSLLCRFAWKTLLQVTYYYAFYVINYIYQLLMPSS